MFHCVITISRRHLKELNIEQHFLFSPGGEKKKSKVQENQKENIRQIISPEPLAATVGLSHSRCERERPCRQNEDSRVTFNKAVTFDSLQKLFSKAVL